MTPLGHPTLPGSPPAADAYVYQPIETKRHALVAAMTVSTPQQWEHFIRRLNDTNPSKWPDADASFDDEFRVRYRGFPHFIPHPPKDGPNV